MTSLPSKGAFELRAYPASHKNDKRKWDDKLVKDRKMVYTNVQKGFRPVWAEPEDNCSFERRMWGKTTKKSRTKPLTALAMAPSVITHPEEWDAQVVRRGQPPRWTSIEDVNLLQKMPKRSEPESPGQFHGEDVDLQATPRESVRRRRRREWQKRLVQEGHTLGYVTLKGAYNRTQAASKPPTQPPQRHTYQLPSHSSATARNHYPLRRTFTLPPLRPAPTSAQSKTPICLDSTQDIPVLLDLQRATASRRSLLHRRRSFA